MSNRPRELAAACFLTKAENIRRANACVIDQSV